MKQTILTFLAAFSLLFSSACANTAAVTPTSAQIQAQVSTLQTTPAASAAAPTSSSAAAAEILEIDTHEESSDYTWSESDEVLIDLQGSTIIAAGSGVMVEGATAYITAPGTYRLSGSLDDGQIVVQTDIEQPVRLILDGVSISNTSSAAIDIEQADKVIIILAEGTTNTLSDGKAYSYATADIDEPNAALFSKADLTISGSGTLSLSGNYADAITSKDGLLIRDAHIEVSAADDGIRGKDYLVIENATISVNAGGDALKSDNDDPEALGAVLIDASSLEINADGDGISAEGTVQINSGTYTIQTGGGSRASLSADASAKAIKGLNVVVINDGSFTLDSADDALHSNGSIVVNGGTFTINTGDDALHADTALTINGGELNILSSYEGLESALITVSGGEIALVASDDGINAASAAAGTGGQMLRGGPGGMGGQAGNFWFYQTGGFIYVNAGGDGVDTNGSASISGGTLLVDGPTDNGNGALDYMGTFSISGGVVAAAGSAGMAMSASQDSSQPSVLIAFESAQQAGTLVSLQNESGLNVLAYAPSKPFQTLLLSSPELKTGGAYSVLLGGSSTGTQQDGLYLGGSTSGADTYAALTLTGTVTTLGTATGFNGPGAPGGPGGRRP